MLLNQGEENKTKHFYTEGNILYSYGSHFPLAIRLLSDDGSFKFIMNSCGYSQTTARHKGLFKRAVKNENDILFFCDTEKLKEIISLNITEMKELLKLKL